MATRKQARLEPFEGALAKVCAGCGRTFYSPSLVAKWCESACRNKVRSATPRGRASRKAYNRRQRVIALNKYGHKCECCGIETFEFLAIDHIEGGGGKHHAELREQGITLTDFLRINNYPPGFQVLCHNCNSARGFYGYCPHKPQEINAQI